MYILTYRVLADVAQVNQYMLTKLKLEIEYVIDVVS